MSKKAPLISPEADGGHLGEQELVVAEHARLQHGGHASAHQVVGQAGERAHVRLAGPESERLCGHVAQGLRLGPGAGAVRLRLVCGDRRQGVK